MVRREWVRPIFREGYSRGSIQGRRNHYDWYGHGRSTILHDYDVIVPQAHGTCAKYITDDQPRQVMPAWMGPADIYLGVMYLASLALT